MKKRLLLITIFLVVGLIIIYIITIPKVTKWTYKINKNYVVKKESDTDIYLYNKKDKVVADYIAEFSYGKKFVLLKCVDTNVNIKFYIIDMSSNTMYGPFLDYTSYEVIRDEVVKEKTGKWIETINYKK